MVESDLLNKCEVRRKTAELFNGTLNESRRAVLTERQKYSRHNESGNLLPRNNESILLIDEIDVFFGPDFFRQTHNPSTPIQNACVEALLRKFWTERDTITVENVKRTDEFNSIKRQYKYMSFYFEHEVNNMIEDAKRFDSPPYIVDKASALIGYFFRDSVDYKKRYRYRTGFAYLYEYEKGSFLACKNIVESNLKKNLSIWVRCGAFSFTNITADLILGFSRSLKYITDEERKDISDFEISSYSFLPSIYGCINFVETFPISTFPGTASFFDEIEEQAHGIIRKRRAVLIFFENDAVLQDFASEKLTSFTNPKILTSTTSEHERDFNVKKAATIGQVTLATAPFCRGTNFAAFDTELDKNGGLHVIQTFFSMNKLEEEYMKATTARQGNNGSYSMVFLDDRLYEQFPKLGDVSTENDLYETLDRLRANAYSNRIASMRQKKQHIMKLDQISHKNMDALNEKNKNKARRLFEQITYNDYFKNITAEAE